MNPITQIIWLVSLIFSSHIAFSNPNQANQSIQKLYHRLNAKPTPMPTRLNQISHYFLNKPYQNNALGEGFDARYDQGPLYQTDAFDCETYVDTVVAIALAPSFDTFPQCINRIRYKNSQVSFITRNHFTSIDWNFNNQQSGILKDITETLVDKNNQPVAIISKTFINKPNWYAKLSEERIRLPNASSKEKKQQHEALKRQGQTLKAETAYTPYVPLAALFDTKGRANAALFNQIPNGAIIEIVRPNWNLETQIGSRLDISHMGFAFRKNGQLRFRHASDTQKKVSDVSLINYLKKARTSPTIRGINIQVVVPSTPSAAYCG